MKVKEVIQFLQHFDPEIDVLSCGPVDGGYEVKNGILNTATIIEGFPFICYQDIPEYPFTFGKNNENTQSKTQCL